MPVGKRPVLKNAGLLLSAREKILNNFKTNIFPTKIVESEPEPTLFATPKPTKERAKKSQPKLCRDFFDKVAHNETNINTEIFNEYSKYQNPTFLLKDLINTNRTKNEKKVIYNANNVIMLIMH